MTPFYSQQVSKLKLAVVIFLTCKRKIIGRKNSEKMLFLKKPRAFPNTYYNLQNRVGDVLEDS